MRRGAVESTEIHQRKFADSRSEIVWGYLFGEDLGKSP